jgi:enoyl-CoA hydratase/carnithine racemase
MISERSAAGGQTDFIAVENQGDVAILRLANGVANAIGPGLVEELAAAIGDLKNRCRGLVLAGNAKFFSIGLDVPHLLKLDRQAMTDFWVRFEDLVLALYTLPIPTACAIGGHATGGGAILALACDFRFVADGKRLIALNEVKIGLPVPYLADLMLRQVVADRVAVKIEYCSAFIGPHEAEAAGLVDAVCEENAVERSALEKIRDLAALPSVAFALTKQHRIREIPGRFLVKRQELNRAFMDCWFGSDTQTLLTEAARKF